MCNITTVFIHCEAVTKYNLWYSSAKLLFNQFFHTLCLHHWFLFPLWTWLFWISYSWFHIILSLSGLSVFWLCSQHSEFCSSSRLRQTMLYLYIVLCTIPAGWSENIEWSWPWIAHVGSPLCVSALSAPNVSMHTHANVEMDLKFDPIFPTVSQLLLDLNTIRFQKHFSFFKIVPFDIVIALYSNRDQNCYCKTHYGSVNVVKNNDMPSPLIVLTLNSQHIFCKN